MTVYIGSTHPTEWPQRACEATYTKYARLPTWHVEEAASLVCGFEPRKSLYLQFHPMAATPATPPPYDGALTWNGLLHGPVGEILSLYGRYKRVTDWQFDGDALYVSPMEFLHF